MLLKGAAFLLAFGPGLANAQTGTVTGPKIAQAPSLGSTSLCGDGYLLSAAPAHINALSWQSRSALSRANAWQKALPQLWDDPEPLTLAKSDIIVYGPGEGRFSAPLVQRRGVKTIHLSWAEDFPAVLDNLDKIALGLIPLSTDQTVRLLKDDLQRRLEQMRIRAQGRTHRPNVLYLSRAGGSAGPGTYVDAAITAAGGTNIIRTPGWQTPEIEFLLTLKPDLIVTSFFSDGYESVQALPLRHFAVRHYINRHPKVDIPGKLWPCAGPGLMDAAEIIAAALDGIDGLNLKAAP